MNIAPQTAPHTAVDGAATQPRWRLQLLGANLLADAQGPARAGVTINPAGAAATPSH